MPRKPDPETERRNAALCEAFQANRSLTDADLGARFGCSAATAGRVLMLAGLISRDNRRTITPYADRKPKSQVIKTLGSVLSEACHLVEGGGRKPSIELGINQMRLTAMRSGLHDFTVLELERIAAWMGITVAELFRVAASKVIKLEE